jgi:hypothetical protein
MAWQQRRVSHQPAHCCHTVCYCLLLRPQPGLRFGCVLHLDLNPVEPSGLMNASPSCCLVRPRFPQSSRRVYALARIFYKHCNAGMCPKFGPSLLKGPSFSRGFAMVMSQPSTPSCTCRPVTQGQAQTFVYACSVLNSARCAWHSSVSRDNRNVHGRRHPYSEQARSKNSCRHDPAPSYMRLGLHVWLPAFHGSKPPPLPVSADIPGLRLVR